MVMNLPVHPETGRRRELHFWRRHRWPSTRLYLGFRLSLPAIVASCFGSTSVASAKASSVRCLFWNDLRRKSYRGLASWCYGRGGIPQAK